MTKECNVHQCSGDNNYMQSDSESKADIFLYGLLFVHSHVQFVKCGL